MPTNAKQFAIDIRRDAETIPRREMSKLVRAVSLEALGRIVRKTPVDTGRARGNWQVGIDSQPNGDRTITDGDRGGAASLAEGKKLGANLPPFATVFITNNVSYIERLEAGWSKKAPTGMVVTTVADLQALFQ